MKAPRLLQLLLLLQTRPRMSTRELAEHLEVSTRTILRDVDALSMAGVPVYAERGRNGGIVLLTNSRINASHLEPTELNVLAIASSNAQHLNDLGLGAASQSTNRKIKARQAQTPADTHLLQISDVVMIDNTAWLEHNTLSVNIATLANDLTHKQRLRIHYRHSSRTEQCEYIVDPYGLVSKAGRWYLIADVDGVSMLFSLERLSHYEILSDRATPGSGRTLHSVWGDLKQRTESLGHIEILAQLRHSRIDLAQRILGNRLVHVSEPHDDWCHVTIRYPTLESVRQLLQFGDHIEILRPKAARQRAQELAYELAHRHS